MVRSSSAGFLAGACSLAMAKVVVERIRVCVLCGVCEVRFFQRGGGSDITFGTGGRHTTAENRLVKA